MTFAQNINMGQSSLSKIENGQTVINIVQLRTISRALNTEPNLVLNEVDRIANNIEKRGIEVKDHMPNQNMNLFLGAAAIAGIIAFILSE